MNTEISYAPTWRRTIAIILDFTIAGATVYFIEDAGRSDGATIAGLIIAGLYLLLKDSIYAGKSIGKMFTGIRVVQKENFGKITFRQGLKRNSPFFGLIALASIAGIISALILSPKIAGKIKGTIFLGGLIYIYRGADGPEKATFGDSLAGTSVIIK